MKPVFEHPTLRAGKPDEISLPNQDLVGLMTAVLAKGKRFRFRAAGGSMDPFIRSGDVLTFAPLSGKPGPGSVAAFLRPSTRQLIVHRIVASGRAGFLMRGDAEPEFDGWISRDQIIALVIRNQRDGQNVRLGLGPERRLIALLSRRNWLLPLRLNPFLQRLRRKVKV